MSNWGKGAKNNTINWGQGACDNTIGWGTSQKDNNSWSGETDISGCSTGLAQIDNVYSMQFDGTGTEQIYIPPYTIPENSTVSFWVKSSLTNPSDVIISGGNTNVGHYYPFLLLSGGNIKLLVKSGSTANGVTTDVPWAANTWFHIAISGANGAGSGSTATFYINGINKGTSLNRTPTLSVIGNYSTSSLAWNGNIDEVAFFDTVLTDAEILSIYNATTTGKTADLSQLTTPPVAWYRM